VHLHDFFFPMYAFLRTLVAVGRPSRCSVVPGADDAIVRRDEYSSDPSLHTVGPGNNGRNQL
jgi:hypothetical protein